MRHFVLTRNYYQRTKRYINPILATVLIVIFVRAFVFDTYRIPSDSMQPTLIDGDHVIGIKLIYGIRLPFGGPYIRFNYPKRTDLVVIKRPDNNYYIKRVIGIGGDTIDLKDGVLSLSGLKVNKKFGVNSKQYRYIDPEQAVYREFIDKDFYSIVYSVSKRPEDLASPVKVAKGSIFLLGDNRTNSIDSRQWGSIDNNDVMARVALVWFSRDPLSGQIRWDRIGLIER